MTKVYTLVEVCDGDVYVDVYGTMSEARDQAEELASLNGWEESETDRWEDPEDCTNYIGVQAKEVL